MWSIHADFEQGFMCNFHVGFKCRILCGLFMQGFCARFQVESSSSVVCVPVCVSARVQALVQTPNQKIKMARNPCDIMTQIWFMEHNTLVD